MAGGVGRGGICLQNDGEGAPFSAWPSTTSCARESESLHRFTTDVWDVWGLDGGVDVSGLDLGNRTLPAAALSPADQTVMSVQVLVPLT